MGGREEGAGEEEKSERERKDSMSWEGKKIRRDSR